MSLQNGRRDGKKTQLAKLILVMLLSDTGMTVLNTSHS